MFRVRRARPEKAEEGGPYVEIRYHNVEIRCQCIDILHHYIEICCRCIETSYQHTDIRYPYVEIRYHYIENLLREASLRKLG